MKLSKNSETNRAERLVFIGKADFSSHSHSYGMNERSKKINSVDLANEPKVYLSAYQSPMDTMLLVIGVERVFRQLQYNL